MATRTDSVPLVPGPHPAAAGLEIQLESLRARCPRAIIDRYQDKIPTLGERALAFPGAALVGEVALGDDASVWYNAVLRGDLAPVVVGARSNVQDGSVLHVGDSSPCVVGSEVVVGHRAMLHGCRVEDGCLIGMQATILDDAVVGEGCIVAAGALITPRTHIPPRSLVLGAPARVLRPVSDDEAAFTRALAGKYQRLKENYRRDALATQAAP